MNPDVASLLSDLLTELPRTETAAFDPSALLKLGEPFAPFAEAVHRKIQLDQNLFKLAARVNADVSLDAALNAFYEEFRGHVPYERIGVSLLTDDGTMVKALWARSDRPDIRLVKGYQAPLAGSSLQPILETGQPRILNDLPAYLEQHPRSHSTRLIVEEGMQSSLTCPLIANGERIGFLFFSHTKKSVYEGAHVDLFLQIAGHLSIVVDKNRSYERLVELNEVKNKFLGIAAHDLRSPLALVKNYLELLQNPDYFQDEQQRTHIFHRVDVVVTRMFNLINDLLDISAIESGNLQISPAPVDFGVLLPETIEHHAMIAQAKEISVRGELGELPTLHVDGRRIQQVLDNLITNAAKFSPRGTTVTVQAAVGPTHLRIAVRDQGKGIPKEEQSKLFKEFGRTSVKPTDGEKSTGLGLAIVKKIVEIHGGVVGVESEVGKGSTFFFSLPMSLRDTPPKQS